MDIKNLTNRLAFAFSVVKAVCELVFYFSTSIVLSLLFKDISLNICLGVFIIFKVTEKIKLIKKLRGEFFGK